MSIAPVPRPVAAATYGFVRFIGGGLAPYAAGKLVEHYNTHVPFILGAVTVVAAPWCSAPSTALTAADAEETQPGPRTSATTPKPPSSRSPGLAGGGHPRRGGTTRGPHPQHPDAVMNHLPQHRPP